MPKAKRRQSGEVIAGSRRLAEALGVSSTSAFQYITHPNWPFGRGPWPREMLEEIRAWRNQLPGRQAGEAPPESQQKRLDFNQARTLKTLESAKIDSLKRKVLEGKLHDADECKRRRTRVILQLTQALQALPDSLPFDDAVRTTVREKIHAMMRVFAADYG